MIAANLDLSLGSIHRPFACRKGTVDEVGIAQALTLGAYDIGRLRRGSELIALYEQLTGSGRSALIVDTMANIGAAAVFFAYRFPAARIIAIEPDTETFALLVANTAGLPIECIQAVVAAERSSDDAAPRSLTVNDIYDRAGEAQPFIVSHDVEGHDLFAANTEWVQRTPVIVASLNDHLVPGTPASRRFVKYAAGWDRDFLYMEDNVFSLSRAPTQAPT